MSLQDTLFPFQTLSKHPLVVCRIVQCRGKGHFQRFPPACDKEDVPFLSWLHYILGSGQVDGICR